jgi:hypothetical protein
MFISQYVITSLVLELEFPDKELYEYSSEKLILSLYFKLNTGPQPCKQIAGSMLTIPHNKSESDLKSCFLHRELKNNN